ncbi:cell wall protein DAN4-like [Leguminivora glycinivorella]|uniref:cell wall protein DAN4-like n=1 Tax=Leguminivora glycinivorella TaxID=1035111 RepID=UPI00200FBE79|nr:cell wall protein DAN4-like [Leguminivora glycinivorella]
MLQSNGYAFNDNNCQMRGDRVLCGYNNEGLETIEPEPANKDCIPRGDRIECGYVNRRTDNRRNNKDIKVVEAGSTIQNVTDYITTDAIEIVVPSYTNATNKTTNTLPPLNNTEVNTRSGVSSIEDQPELSKIDTEELLEDVEKSIALIITNASISTTSVTTTPRVFTDTSTMTNTPSSTTIRETQTKFDSLKIFELIDRVEKILSSAGAITTSKTNNASNKSFTPMSTLKEPTNVFNMTGRKSNENSSTRTADFTINTSVSTSATTNTNITSPSTKSTSITTTSTTSTTSTSTTTSATTTTTTTTTTPIPYIDDAEYCVEKDGRIVCYDNPQEVYDIDDDFLEK